MVRSALTTISNGIFIFARYASADQNSGARSIARVISRRSPPDRVNAAADVVVMPSYREAQGLAIIEALAANRPVVASNVGGIPEMIVDGENGLLVPSHDPSALAAATADSPSHRATTRT